MLQCLPIVRRSWQAVLVSLSVCWLCFAQPSLATTRAEIYQVTAPAADRSEAGLSAAFQTAMRSVLVRVTGHRSAEQDAALAPLISGARRYVQQYRNAADGQIWVAFDGAAIERWLAQNNQPIWGSDRPTTVILVAAQTSAQNGVVLTAEDTSELKASIDAAASNRGLPLTWPTAGDVQRYHLDFASINGGSTGALVDIGRKLGGEGVLIGRASGLTGTAAVRWSHQFQDRGSEYAGTIEGPNRVADLYAGMFSATGSSAPIDIDVAGVTNLREYANVETYLESLTSISHVGVASLTGDVVRFHLATRGGADALLRALSLSGRLQPVAGGDNGIQRFQLRR